MARMNPSAKPAVEQAFAHFIQGVATGIVLNEGATAASAITKRLDPSALMFLAGLALGDYMSPREASADASEKGGSEIECGRSGGPKEIGGLRFDVSLFDMFVSDREMAKALKARCNGRPLFSVPRNPLTSSMGPEWLTQMVTHMLCSRPGVLEKMINGEIPLKGQPLTTVVPDAFPKWKNTPVRVYKTKEIVRVDPRFLHQFVGRPVFAPDDEKQPITEEWVSKTIRVLTSHPDLSRQILAGKLRFLGQPLSEVMEGASIAGTRMVFVEEDFYVRLIVDPERARLHGELKKAMVGRPVFLPEEGCEYVLAKKNSIHPSRPRWAAAVGHLVFSFPELADGVISGKIEVDGRRVTDIPLSPLPPHNLQPSAPLHCLISRRKWERSYARRLISLADLPRGKPEWALWMTDVQYFRFLRQTVERPIIVHSKLASEVGGFYNEKHRKLNNLIDIAADDDLNF